MSTDPNQGALIRGRRSAWSVMLNMVQFGARWRSAAVKPIPLPADPPAAAAPPANAGAVTAIATVAEQAGILGMEVGDIAGSVAALSARLAANVTQFDAMRERAGEVIAGNQRVVAAAGTAE